MSQDVLDDWIASLLSTRSNMEIAKLVHVGQDRVRAVRAAQADHTRILHRIGHPVKVPQIISERFAIPTARATIN
jgi:hypothetical protein